MQENQKLDKDIIKKYILEHKQKDIFNEIFESGLQIDFQTRAKLSDIFAQIIANYCKMNFEALFRK